MIIAIYARVSTDQQAEKGYSLNTQLAECRKKASELEDKAQIEEFIDDGYSGAFLERPALEKLRKGLREKLFSAVIVLDPDRLARNLTHQLIITDEIETSGAKLLFVNFEWQNTPEGKLFYSIRGAVSAYEREKIKERSQRGKRGKALSGKIVRNNRPYGYNWDSANSMYIVNEAEAKMIRQIFSWVVDEHLGIRAIATQLTKMNYPTRSGTASWNIGTVYDIINREAYAGIHWANREYKTKNGLKKVIRGKRSRSEWIPVNVPPIISRKVWEAAQVQLKLNKHITKQPITYPFVCRNLMVCPLCGAKMRSIVSGTNKKPYYICKTGRAISGKSKTKDSCKCPARQIPAQLVDDHVWDYVSGILNDPALLEAELAQKVPDDKILLLEERLEQLEIKGQQLIKERNHISLLFKQDLIDFSFAEAQLKEIKKALISNEKTRAELKHDLEDLTVKSNSGHNKPKEYLKTDISADMKREVLLAIIKKIEAQRIDQGIKKPQINIKISFRLNKKEQH